MFNSYVSLPEGIWAPIPENRLLCVCVCVQIDIEDTLVIYYFYSQKKGDIDV